MVRPRINMTEAYNVNLMDTTGDHLMSEKQYMEIVDNELGRIIDSMKLPFIGIREKMALHDAIKERINELHGVWSMIDALNDAKPDALAQFCE